MELLNNPKYKALFIISVLVILSAFTLWIRLTPLLQLGNGDILNLVGSDDPQYNLRQVESLLANFPKYAWFDPMTTYPTGEIIYWGPLFTYISAILCIIAGAATRPEIIKVALFVPLLMAVAMVPVMYWFGRTLADWKTGLFAALMIAVISGQYFFRSLYGYFDHHIAEVFFSTLFCALYVYTLTKAKSAPIVLSDLQTYRDILLLSIVAGIAFLLGFFTMPTIVVFALIVGAFTLVQCVINHHRSKSSLYLVIINTVAFGIVSIGILLYGFRHEGLDLSRYTAGQVFAYGLLIAATIFLYIWSEYLNDKQKYYYILSFMGIAILFLAVLAVLFPSLLTEFMAGLSGFFGQAPVTTTIQEARGWNLPQAWNAFHYGLVLMLGGALIFIYRNLKDEQPGQVFILIWSFVMLFSTWQHVRYEYYLAANIALLSAVCLGSAWEMGARPTLHKIRSISTATHEERKEKESAKKPGKKGKSPKEGERTGKKAKGESKKDTVPSIAVFILAIALSLLFVYSSVTYSYAMSANKILWMNQDWKESLLWMGNSTPDTGVDYYKVYDKTTFQYPPQSYGVMSWWDYGHLITYIAKRIPNANPFQRGVAGPTGAAAYFLLPSEDAANAILDTLGTKYVITDIEMDTGKFWAMATWYNSSVAGQPYNQIYTMQNPVNPSQLVPVQAFTQDYYETMVSRLHNFDGSRIEPAQVYYIEYTETQINGVTYPVITSGIAMNFTAANAAVNAFNARAGTGTRAALFSTSVILPLGELPALKHYRLVHESPSNVLQDNVSDLKYVKVFEYVKGAHLKGTGIIEVPLVTNTGRTFTYRQASENGEFIVPYSTTGGSNAVKATGRYHIAGTNQYFDVPETAVIEGKSIS